MATYVNDLRLKEIATGDEAGTWGTSTNTNLELIGEALGYGTQNCFASDADATTTVADGATDPARAMYFKVTSSATLTATRTLTIAPNTISRVMLIENATTGSQSITISQGSGSTVTIASGAVKMVYLDGAGAGGAVVEALADLELPTVTVADLTATTADINGGTIDGTVIGGTTPAAGTFTTLTANGNVVLGDAATDTVTVTADIASDLIPSADGSFDLGASGAEWQDLFIDGTANIDSLVADTADINAGTIDGTVIGGSTAAAITGTTITGTSFVSSGDMTFGDSDKAIFGAGSDLQIYHDGSESYIDDAGTGSLLLRGSNSVQMRKQGTTELMLRAVVDADVELYYDGSEKLATTATGIDVTGTVTADGLTTATAGTSNFRAGVNAGNSIIAGGNYNVVVGDEAGTAITTGEENTFIGYTAGDATTTASGNTALGFSALTTNVLGSRSVAIGRAALQVQNPATATNMYNVAVGHGAGESVTTGTQNTLIGGLAGDAITTASSNTALGYQALTNTTTGASNVAVGANASWNNSTGVQNVSVGVQALNAATTASNNTAVGYQSGYTNTTGTQLTAVGWRAFYFQTTANENTGVGYAAGYNTTTGASNSAFGKESLVSNTTGSFNTSLGASALYSNTTASNNTAVGYQAGYTNTTGTRNTFVGRGTGYTSNGDDNTAVGRDALYNNTTGSGNAVLGVDALTANTTGGLNTAIGYLALNSNTTASSNTAVGYQAGYSNTTGTENVYIGQVAGYTNSTGNNNTFIGRYAGYSTTGGDNTFVGRASGNAITSGTKNTILGRYDGNQGGLDIRTSSNHIVLSDGDGNPRGIFNSSGNFLVGRSVATTTSKIQSEEGITIYYPTTNAYWDIYRSSDNTLRFVDGSVSAYLSTGGAWTNASDARLKKDIVESVHGLASVLASSPRSYQFRHIDGPQVGFIAQELQAVIPEVVEGAEDGAEMMGINYGALTAVAFKAIQEQQAIIESLTARIEALEGA